MMSGLILNLKWGKKVDFEFCVIDGQTSNDIIEAHPNEIFQLIQTAYVAHEVGEAVNPPSYFFRIPEKPNARIIALPSAITREDKVVGMKWIGSNPDNVQYNFPRASATIILNDYETFYPYACLEGSIISAVRTAYSAVIAASCIKEKDKKIKKLGVVGNGLIAKYVYKAFVADGWEINEISLFDQSRKSSEKWKAYVNEESRESVHIATQLEDLLKQSDMIVLTTSALEPYITDATLFQHNPVVLNISLRDLAPQILLQSNNIVDDVEHVLQAKTSPDLAYQACGHKDFINGTIGRFIQHTIMLSPHKPTIFSPMGMGMLDMAVAHFIYKKSKESGREINIPGFFFDLSR